MHINEKTFYFKGRLHFNVPVWFLLAMFQVLVIAKIIRLEKYKTWGKFLTAFICFALAYVFYNVYHFPYFGIDKAILCLGFYSVGGGTLRSARKDKKQGPCFLSCHNFNNALAFVFCTYETKSKSIWFQT